MSIDLAKLAGQGRAFSGARPWTPEELNALLRFENERALTRIVAADYVRNGIVTLGDYDKAVEASFQPKTLDDAAAQAEASLKDHAFASDKTPEAPASEPAPEVVAEASQPAQATATPEQPAKKKTKKSQTK